jgi:Tfp pilus assembly protein PilN
MSSPSINLIPKTEKTEQTTTKLVKASTLFSVALLVVLLGIAGYLFYKTSTLKKEVKALDDSIEASREEIANMASVEISARNLYSKYTTLKKIFGERAYYSVLLEEFEKRVPSSVVITSFTMAPGSSISIGGSGENYNSIGVFTDNLLDVSFTTASEGLGGLFKSVSLESVSLESKENRASFNLVIEYDSALLNK